jgi:hypothetical protein
MNGAGNMTLEGNKSTALKNMLDAVKDQTAPVIDDSGNSIVMLTYNKEIGFDLKRIIGCRAYSIELRNLCHVLLAVAACGRGIRSLENIFWGPSVRPVTPNKLLYALTELSSASPSTPKITVKNRTLIVRYGDGFQIVPIRDMPLLWAFMDFLIEALGWQPFLKLYERFEKEPATMALVGEVRNGLDRELYRFLNDHLPKKDAQSALGSVVKFLEMKRGNDFTIDDVTDDDMFEFWKTWSLASDGRTNNFKKFSTVFKTFGRFFATYEVGVNATMVANARSIGYDAQSGEVDPESIYKGCQYVHDLYDAANRLAEDPINEIQFLNKKEFTTVSIVVRWWPLVSRLPLSKLRLGVFGAAQENVVQWSRKNTNATITRELLEFLVKETYPSRALACSDIVDLGHRTQLAGFHVVAKCRDPAAIDLAGHLRPGIDKDVLIAVLGLEEDESFINPNSAQSGTKYVYMAKKEREQVHVLMNQAKDAFNGLNRKGFSKVPEPDSSLAEGFRVGTEIIAALMGPFGKFSRMAKTIAVGIPGDDAPFPIDKTLFCNHLMQLYGA